MADGRERFRGRASDALRRRLRRDELGVGLLELGELAVETVVFGVGDLGPVEDVIQVVVPVELLAEGRRTLTRAFELGLRGHYRLRVVLDVAPRVLVRRAGARSPAASRTFSSSVSSASRTCSAGACSLRTAIEKRRIVSRSGKRTSSTRTSG